MMGQSSCFPVHGVSRDLEVGFTLVQRMHLAGNVLPSHGCCTQLEGAGGGPVGCVT